MPSNDSSGADIPLTDNMKRALEGALCSFCAHRPHGEGPCTQCSCRILKGSAGSSPDDFCGWCKHHSRHHDRGTCFLCPSGDCRHTFVPAEPETAEEPECDGCGHAPHVADQCPGRTFGERCECDEPLAGEPEGPCINSGGCRYLVGSHCAHGCREAADAVTRLGEEMEPEAPEEPFPAALKAAGVDVELVNVIARRPPYAVAYALASGELYEVALSGDAVATAEDGVLKVSHPAGVARIVQVKPIEGP